MKIQLTDVFGTKRCWSAPKVIQMERMSEWISVLVQRVLCWREGSRPGAGAVDHHVGSRASRRL